MKRLNLSSNSVNCIINWLLDGDVSIQYQTHRLLLDSGQEVLVSLQDKIACEGFGAGLLACRNQEGHWGRWFYQPKWTSTHYTLLDLKNLGVSPKTQACREMVQRAFNERMIESGGVNFAKSMVKCDLAVNGMILNYAAWFCPEDIRTERLTSFILAHSLSDGCYSWDTDSDKGDLDTTICVLEGLNSYRQNGLTCFKEEIHKAEHRTIEYLLSNNLFMNANNRYLTLSYPYRYRYDVLRALEYFASANIPYDPRMQPALKWLSEKMNASCLCHLENVHKGNVHFNMEIKGAPSRFITLKALYILKTYGDYV